MNFANIKTSFRSYGIISHSYQKLENHIWIRRNIEPKCRVKFDYTTQRFYDLEPIHKHVKLTHTQKQNIMYDFELFKETRNPNAYSLKILIYKKEEITKNNIKDTFVLAHNDEAIWVYNDNKTHIDELEENLEAFPIYPQFEEIMEYNSQFNYIADINLWGNRIVNFKTHVGISDAMMFVEWFIEIYETLYLKKHGTISNEQIFKWIETWLKKLAFMSNWVFGVMWSELNERWFTEEYFVLDNNNILQPSQKLVDIAHSLPHSQEAVWCPFMKVKKYADFFWKIVVGMYIKYRK